MRRRASPLGLSALAIGRMLPPRWSNLLGADSLGSRFYPASLIRICGSPAVTPRNGRNCPSSEVFVHAHENLLHSVDDRFPTVVPNHALASGLFDRPATARVVQQIDHRERKRFRVILKADLATV